MTAPFGNHVSGDFPTARARSSVGNKSKSPLTRKNIPPLPRSTEYSSKRKRPALPRASAMLLCRNLLRAGAQFYTGCPTKSETFDKRPRIMSFRLQPPAPARPNRCQLFGPASNPKLFEKMAASDADVINIDLEDSVSPGDKDTARANAVAAINEVDWGNKTLSVRINGLDTGWWYRDVVDLLEAGGDRLDQIMIPKVGCAGDIYAVDALVTAIEAARGRAERLGFEVIIESAAGLSH